MGERKSSSKEKSSRKKRLKVSSKALHCRSGRAYLINKVSDFVNEEEEVNLNTMGEHKSSSKKNSSRMKRLNVSSKDLEGKTFNCKFCKTKLARADQLITKKGFDLGRLRLCEVKNGEIIFGASLWQNLQVQILRCQTWSRWFTCFKGTIFPLFIIFG
ncbi:uncharacterized protein [Solanum lycopersicum]|uniref:uncharacterized protein isoform X6 n=1 Tax=Solanum lycopersicum TaxID=4081 RepID=UPI0037480692